MLMTIMVMLAINYDSSSANDNNNVVSHANARMPYPS
jgi:hypothetical protein